MEPSINPLSKRTKKPSHKLTDIDNGGELELKSHKIARDRAIAADKAKSSHEPVRSAVAGKSAPTAFPPTSITSNDVPSRSIPAVAPGANITAATNATTTGTTTGSTISSKSKRAAVHDCTDVDDPDDIARKSVSICMPVSY